jgi:hypothetical protein
MTIQIPADLEAAVNGEAKRLGIAPERFVEQALRDHLNFGGGRVSYMHEPRDDWEKQLRAIARPCGVSLSDEALSSEGLYD